MTTVSQVPLAVLQSLSERSRACVERLALYKREEAELTPEKPSSKLAAVLVLLYERSSQLRVLLTTRSKLLRSHPGQTAFPGGKVEETDLNIFETAYREAYEEVALPLQSAHVHNICLLEPFLSPSKLLVTPVVALLSNLSALDELKPGEGEVSKIFDHPLEAILDPTLAKSEPLVPRESEHWPYDAEYQYSSDIVVPMFNNATYRMHRFRSIASPVKGLTSDILIKTAEIAYGTSPTYERYAPGQMHGIRLIEQVT